MLQPPWRVARGRQLEQKAQGGLDIAANCHPSKAGQADRANAWWPSPAGVGVEVGGWRGGGLRGGAISMRQCNGTGASGSGRYWGNSLWAGERSLSLLLEAGLGSGVLLGYKENPKP